MNSMGRNKIMAIARGLAATVVFGGLALGLAATASAASQMSGHYIETLTNPVNGLSATHDWYFTPCGDGCANASGSSPIPGGQARLVNGQWTIDGPIVIRCPDGTSVPGVETAHYTWDPNTLVGTLQATQTKEACGYETGSLTMNVQLRQAP
jgi:hypothetical protein